MKNIKSFTRASRELVETELVKTGVLKDAPLTLYGETGKRLPQQKAARRHEFNKAGNLYLCDVVKYICTHESAFLDETASYYSTRLSWTAFVKRAIGDNQDQYYRLCKEVMRTMEKQELCYIPKADGGYYFMQPFVVALESEDNDKLAPKELQNLANLSKSSKSSQMKAKVGYITVLFAKPLFQKHLKEGGQFYQHPSCFYAHVHKYLQHWDGSMKETVSRPALEEQPVVASDQMESAVVDAIDFLYKHGAGGGRNSRITVNLVDLLRSCYPAAVDHKGNKYYPRMAMATVFMNAVVSVIRNLDGLDYKITGFKIDKAGSIVLNLSHPKRLKAVTGEVSQNREGGFAE
ncbi:MAG: hypothetical protein LBK61_11475 [Spirochaetaceae bacterium]|jgi:hypothetical protein|nr:hypothetical protein [Spirochaetaceae bacterium]